MSTYSILMPFAPSRPEQVLPFAALAQWSRADRLWQGQGTAGDTHLAFSYAAASGFRVPVGTAVNLMPFCHPYDAALRAHSLAVTVNHPVVAGFGPGATALQRNILGAPYRSQLGAVRDYVTIVRALLEQGQVEHDGEFFRCHGTLPRAPRPAVQIGLGVLRPGMARLAGEIADVAVTWLTPAGYLRDTVIPALREGARAAGRGVPRVVAIVPVALDLPEREATEVALASNAGHLRLPHYIDMLSRSGIHVDPAGDPVTNAKALIAGGAFIYGDTDHLAARLAEFAAAGVDEVALNLTGVAMRYGTRTALPELETILNRVTS